MLTKGTVFLIGCALVPSPPSPCPDFGLQILLVLLIGVLSPKILIKPVTIFLIYLGRFTRWIFGKIPGIRVIVYKTDDAIKKFESEIQKKREFENRYVNFLYKIIIKDDLFQRILFGYFVTTVLGAVLMLISIFCM
ncbi:MAG: hypothetical protein J7L45_02835 [Candidatus Aenigmarchaeota archaeon]|nr:hypothetical protein [Candidatus Aenigmarchaeota archaeon]